MYERYCKLRDLKELTDAQVSKYCGLEKSTFTDWKKGKSIPKLPKIIKIAECLDCSIDYLATGKEKSYPKLADLLINIRNDKALIYALGKYFKLTEENKEHVLNTIDVLSEV